MAEPPSVVLDCLAVRPKELKLSSCVLIAATFLLLLSVSSARAQGSESGAEGSAPEKVLLTSKPPTQTVLYPAPQLLGIYGSDGRFKKAVRRVWFRTEPLSGPQSSHLSEVPTSIKLHCVELLIENYAPPAHAIKRMRTPSQLASVRNDFFTLLYGHEQVLYAPTHIATDSKGRVIISDPEQHAIHVLDDKNSFRIAAGEGYRLQQPNGLAVDKDDNIYVADEKLGTVQVYGPDGRYLRTLGDYKGENMFDRPTGIAIDREAGRLYVLDATIGELNVLDLQGQRLRRIGGRRDRKGTVKFDYPTEIAAANNVVVVLDSGGTRIQVLDSELNLRYQFKVRNVNGPPDGIELGLALDNEGRIFVSNLSSSRIKIYEQSGREVGSIEQFGAGKQTFRSPAGVWIDSADRLYVADTANSSVEVFTSALPQARQR